MYSKQKQAGRYSKKNKTSIVRSSADHNFSLYIRIRDIIVVVDGMALEAYCRCISCGRTIHWKKRFKRDTNAAECGHFISRGNYNLRFNEQNCNAQCNHCNRHLNGNQYEYSLSLDTIYGKGTAENLRNISLYKGGKRIFSKEELKIISNDYKLKTVKLAKEKGLDVSKVIKMVA